MKYWGIYILVRRDREGKGYGEGVSLYVLNKIKIMG